MNRRLLGNCGKSLTFSILRTHIVEHVALFEHKQRRTGHDGEILSQISFFSCVNLCQRNRLWVGVLQFLGRLFVCGRKELARSAPKILSCTYEKIIWRYTVKIYLGE